MITLFANPLVKMMFGKLIEDIANELISQKPGETAEENVEKIKSALNNHLPKFWKQKKFYLAVLTVVILVLNQIFGWSISVESLVCIS